MGRIARAGGGGRPSLELNLSRGNFATGQRLSGVVVLRSRGPVNIRALTVSLTGCEKPAGPSLARAIRRREAFFQREILLSGRDQPRLTSDRLSQLWNAILGRDTGRQLSPGEHIYPFSIPLPASLPPSYEGRAGRIDYRASARVHFPAGGAIKAFADVPVCFVPRPRRPRPVALSYPTAGGQVHSTQTNVRLELEQQAVELGGSLAGGFAVGNPQRTPIPRVIVSLEMCEWVRPAATRELHRDAVDVRAIEPDPPDAPEMEGSFELSVPSSALPTVEGTTISVIWLVKLALDTEPPVELKTPITVYAPLPGE